MIVTVVLIPVCEKLSEKGFAAGSLVIHGSDFSGSRRQRFRWPINGIPKTNSNGRIA
jgi:hypothetical protein